MRSSVRTIVLALISVLIALLVAELTLRLLPRTLVGDLGPARLNVEFFDFGPWYTPDQTASYTKSCFSTYPVSINNHGMRDRDRNLEKSAGVFRIAVLGDSYMDAVQVADGKYVAALLEQQLHRPDRAVEVLNFGFSGYGTAQELWLYRHKVRHFKPDLVLLFFLAGNDIQNNSMKLDYASYGYELEDYGKSHVVPFAYFDSNGVSLIEKPNIRLNSSLKRFAKEQLLHRFFLADFLYEKYLYLRAYQGTKELSRSEEKLEEIDSAPLIEEEPTEKPVTVPDTPEELETREDWAKAWSLTRLIFQTLHREIKVDGADLAVILIPAYGGSKHDKSVSMVQDLGLPHLDLAVPMGQSMVAEGLGDADISHSCDAHWNETGHRLAAEATAEWLTPRINKP